MNVVCWCTNANHHWSYVANVQSPSCEVTNHAVTLVLNVNHHWWIGSGTREASWQISHLNCTSAILHMWILMKMLIQRPVYTHNTYRAAYSMYALMHLHGLNSALGNYSTRFTLWHDMTLHGTTLAVMWGLCSPKIILTILYADTQRDSQAS